MEGSCRCVKMKNIKLKKIVKGKTNNRFKLQIVQRQFVLICPLINNVIMSLVIRVCTD